jgi:hypothetical protein
MRQKLPVGMRPWKTRGRLTAEFVMGDHQLERIYEYRVLYAKQSDLHIPLTPEERARALKLQEELPDRVPAIDERDAFTVVPTPLAVQYVVAGAFGVGTEEEPPNLGQRMIVHVHDPQQGVEYTFPCRVVARVVKAPASMGLRFEGMPSQTRIAHSSGMQWRSDVFPPEEHIPLTSRQKGA